MESEKKSQNTEKITKYGGKSPKLTYSNITQGNLEAFKLINKLCFPVDYSLKFYNYVLESDNRFAKMVRWNGVLVGAFSCRSLNDGKTLYIATLGVLSCYQKCGVGSKMLEYLLNAAKEDSSIEEIILHVHTINESAIRMYKKCGFEVTEHLENYYKKIHPRDAYLLKYIK
eukprot:TRINITY_DN2960_c0_g4_i1.p1 TRINITY_DN2960_c0_g4~~TRINITY_DN2960_c0_g4_i1.p1  ORF type:complete len:171 (-),score=19.95 TRINITY_DN2960_c0_g4_i1:280-792(-)